jgi:dihydrodipicolinate synthase/N-acetylneuraminate lyase
MNSAKNNLFNDVDRFQVQTDEILSIYKNGHLLGESIATLKYLVSISGIISPYMLSPLTELSLDKKREALQKWEHIDKNWK